jgi:small subunit ribosomal protein S21
LAGGRRRVAGVIWKKAISMEIKVIDNDVERAIKLLKNKLNKSGLFRELKKRRHYEKPSVRRKKKHQEALKRLAKKRRMSIR